MKNFLVPGRNCWRVEKANHASILIDCGNYYRNVYESVCKARHSVFILGWDIDSRIELLRGKKACQHEGPTQLFALLQWKAKQNPDLKIYLNRWDFSFFQRAERERFGRLKWHSRSPENIFYCLDNIVPLGGCQHQKIITVDDEIAFSGGMDIALQRWDFREHYPDNPDRLDPEGPKGDTKIKYNPFHDIQCTVSGPAAHALAGLVRERWRHAAGFDPVPLRTVTSNELPSVWPDSNPPDFEDIATGISLTSPAVYGNKALFQVKQLFLDQIRSAEQFIYIENQFLTDLDIAHTINAQLLKKPTLRILVVSSHKPKGIMERKAMWNGRVRFRDLAEANGAKNRIAFCYPISRLNGTECPVRIHSKVMIVDDWQLRIGSANANRRSMYLDTECDLLFIAENDVAKAKISAIRNDLIREHTGLESDHIEELVRKGRCIDAFLNYISTSRQHLCKINDEHYRYESISSLASFFADPTGPLLPMALTMPSYHSSIQKNWFRIGVLCLTFILFLISIWYFTPLSHYASAERVLQILEKYRMTAWGIPVMLTAFVLGGLLFFPLFVLITATGIAFGAVKGLFIALFGAMMSALTSYFIGRYCGIRLVRLLTGHKAEKLKSYTERAGVAGIALLRMLPLAPFTIVNMALGLSGLSLSTYIIGTALGLLPGLFIITFLGSSMTEILRHPEKTEIFPLIVGFGGWISIIAFSHWINYRRQKYKSRK